MRNICPHLGTTGSYPIAVCRFSSLWVMTSHHALQHVIMGHHSTSHGTLGYDRPPPVIFRCGPRDLLESLNRADPHRPLLGPMGHFRKHHTGLFAADRAFRPVSSRKSAPRILRVSVCPVTDAKFRSKMRSRHPLCRPDAVRPHLSNAFRPPGV